MCFSRGSHATNNSQPNGLLNIGMVLAGAASILCELTALDAPLELGYSRGLVRMCSDHPVDTGLTGCARSRVL
jgi:hypothetical protein